MDRICREKTKTCMSRCHSCSYVSKIDNVHHSLCGEKIQGFFKVLK